MGRTKSEIFKDWYYRNKDKVKAYSAKYAEENQDKILSYRNSIEYFVRAIYKSQEKCSRTRGHNNPSYSSDEFKEYCLNNQEFIDLYKIWVDGGKQLQQKPSFDRIDIEKGYSFDNIQLMTFKENTDKGRIETNHKRETEIDVFDMDMNFIKRFSSLKSAKDFTGVAIENMAKNARGHISHAGGYQFRYTENYVRLNQSHYNDLVDLMSNCIDEHGFVCGPMIFNSGFVKNKTSKWDFIDISKVNPKMTERVFSKNIKRIQENNEFYRAESKRTGRKIIFYYKDLSRFLDNSNNKDVMDDINSIQFV